MPTLLNDLYMKYRSGRAVYGTNGFTASVHTVSVQDHELCNVSVKRGEPQDRYRFAILPVNIIQFNYTRLMRSSFGYPDYAMQAVCSENM